MMHEEYMKQAIDEAKKAGQNGEVPIGAILVAENGEVLSSAYNRTISLCDPSAHAIKNYRLLGTILYVTVEPCIMCMGAIIHARIKSVVFGTYDPKGGAAGSLYNFAEDKRLNHRTEVIPGVCEEKCRSLMREFFIKKRGS